MGFWLAIIFCASAALAASRVSRMQSAQQGQEQGQQQQTDQQKKKNQNKNSQANGANNSSDSNAGANSQPANSGNSANAGGKPAPLFGGTLTLKSSRQTKDSATMGFNGVDPNGQVQQAFLNASPSPDDMAKAQLVAQYQVNAADLSAFLQQGDLSASAPARKTK